MYGLKYVATAKYQSIRVPFLEYFVHLKSLVRVTDTRNRVPELKFQLISHGS